MGLALMEEDFLIGGEEECEMEKRGERCQVHDEFTKRLDDKWDTHHKHQTGVNSEIFQRMGKIESKLNWLLGAVAVGFPLLQVIIHFILDKQK